MGAMGAMGAEKPSLTRRQMTKRLKMTILDLLISEGFQPKKIASTNGGEYTGACPFCGGQDRFRIWPEAKGGGRYWCRKCGKKGDAIQYLRDKDGLSYRDACMKLGVAPAMNHSAKVSRIKKKVAFEEKHEPPGDKWQHYAGLYIETFQEWLWKEEVENARDFLYGKGISDESIKSAGLGWNPLARYLSREEWGIPVEMKPDGKPKKLWIPKGLVIPCYANERIIRLRVRCADPDKYSKYVLIPGSDMRPMVWNTDKKVVVIVESELDGLLLHQEAGDLVEVVALGSAQAKPDQETHDLLQMADWILIALDSDDAGAKAAWTYWPETYGCKVKRWPCIKGKDPSEAWANELDIRAWVMAGLPEKQSPEEPFTAAEKTTETIPEKEFDNSEGIPFPSELAQRFSEKQLERLAIMTIDGGMSDEEAIRIIQPAVA
jgi:DNA primase